VDDSISGAEGAHAVNQEQQENGPAIVVFSTSLQLLHMNRSAMSLLSQLSHHADIGTERALATLLHEHCHDIIDTMQLRLGSNNCGPVHQYRTIGNVTHSVLLRGFGVSDSRGLPHARIVMLLSPCGQASTRAIINGEAPEAAFPSMGRNLGGRLAKGI